MRLCVLVCVCLCVCACACVCVCVSTNLTRLSIIRIRTFTQIIHTCPNATTGHLSLLKHTATSPTLRMRPWQEREVVITHGILSVSLPEEPICHEPAVCVSEFESGQVRLSDWVWNGRGRAYTEKDMCVSQREKQSTHATEATKRLKYTYTHTREKTHTHTLTQALTHTQIYSHIYAKASGAHTISLSQYFLPSFSPFSNTHSLPVCISLSLCASLSLSQSLSLTGTLTHTLSLSLSVLHPLTSPHFPRKHTLSLSLCLSLSLTLTLSLSLPILLCIL